MKRVILNHLIFNHKYDIIMTVKELIDELLKVEDKSKEVEIYITCGTDYEKVTHVSECSDSVIIS